MQNEKEFLKIINQRLSALDLDKEPLKLYAPIRYTLSVGGKRIRPILCLMANELFSGNYQDALQAALGIEVLHNFTLLHDDIMDKSTVRRGQETVYIKWDENVAILSGDAMSIISYNFISDSNNLKETLKTFSNTALEICEGQQYDMDFESTLDVSVEDYLKMIRLKTAVLLAASLKIGGISANASHTDCEAIYQAGINLGLAFQLQDDLLDTYGDLATFGKNIGDDITINKKTYLLIKALNLANPEQRKELEYWLNLKEFDKDEKILAVRSIYDLLNIKSSCSALIKNYFDKANDIIDEINAPEDKKVILRNYINSMRHREY